jgi:L-asparaginase
LLLIANSEASSGIRQACARLAEGAFGLDALETGIRLVEADRDVRTVGRGGWPNILGEVELDAAVMDGSTLRSGAVGALKGFLYPVSVARAVMERLPHEFLVGEGAARFAAEIGAERDSNLVPETEAAWRELVGKLSGKHWSEATRGPLIGLARHAMDPELVRDTTVFVSSDHSGNITSATSTSGWAWKYPGRLGDSPVIGAGSYADSEHGACACTHTGEMTIRAGTARAVVLYMKLGRSVAEAVEEAVRDLARLKGGQLGGVVMHAIDTRGGHSVVAVNCPDRIQYWMWTDGMGEPELRDAVHRSI